MCGTSSEMKGETVATKENVSRRQRSNPVSIGGRSRKSAKASLFTRDEDSAMGLQEIESKVDGGSRQVVVWNNNFISLAASSDFQRPNTSSGNFRKSPNGRQNFEQVCNNRSDISSPVRSPLPARVFESPQTCRSLSKSPPTPVYAGAKFSEAPSAKVLPKPPVHWVEVPASAMPPSTCRVGGTCREMTDALKGLLKVQC